MLVAEAELVVYGEVLSTHGVVGARDHPALARRLKVLRVLKGTAEPGAEVRFVQHGHGVPRYERGEAAILFLRDLARSRELRSLRTNGLRWYSDQERDDAWVLTKGQREETLSAVRRYAAIEKAPAAERAAMLREATLNLLGSRNPRLARSVLRDLTLASDSPPLETGDVPRLLRVVDNAATSIDVRVGLLAELHQRGLVTEDAHWARLLRATRGAERLAAIPAAGAHRGPHVDAELDKILAGPDSISASAAAVALGQPGNGAAVGPLSRALRSGDTRVALSAIRGLTGVGSPEAWEAIRNAAEMHPDPAVRRKARAALRVELEP